MQTVHPGTHSLVGATRASVGAAVISGAELVVRSVTEAVQGGTTNVGRSLPVKEQSSQHLPLELACNFS